MSMSTPNTTDARHQAAAAPSPVRREAEVAGSVPYRRQGGTPCQRVRPATRFPASPQSSTLVGGAARVLVGRRAAAG